MPPGRFGDARFMRDMDAVDVALSVVDRAHRISEWGHDFRPDYLRPDQAAERHGRPPILALTATASLLIRREIVERRSLREPDMLVHEVDRPNL